MKPEFVVRLRSIKLLMALLLFVSPLLRAELTIEVTQGVDNPTRIAIVPFQQAGGGVSTDIASIVAADLKRSGQFAPLARDAMYSTPFSASEVHYRDWRALGVDYLLIGRLEPAGSDGSATLHTELFDVHRQKAVMKTRHGDAKARGRALAHAAADAVYEKLTGIAGAFSTRILYVSVKTDAQRKQNYRLIIADADGANHRVVLNSSEPILSPSWSRDGRDIAYVSFESSRPAIYRQRVATGKREKLTGFRGLNSAPAWSPDGRSMAMVLSKDGNPEIYVMNLDSGALRRITNHYAIDTEPAWMPDGKSLLFTSDRGGTPQIYKVQLANGDVSRVTFTGSYNAKVSILPEGDSIVSIHRKDRSSGYHIAWQDLGSGRTIVLTSSSLDESPSVAPNGSMLLYATKYRGRGVLAAVSLDGGVKFRLPSPTADVREPAWSPMLK